MRFPRLLEGSGLLGPPEKSGPVAGERLLFFILGLCLFWLAASQVYDPAIPRSDFAHDYAAGLLVRQGRGPEIYSASDDFFMPEEVRSQLAARGFPGDYVTRFFSHPFYALVMVPFSFLPYKVAATLFLALQVALWALWLWALFRKQNPFYFLAGMAALLLFYPAREGLVAGQVTGLLLPVIGYFVIRPDKTLSQVGLALSFLVKPVALALPLLFFVRRKWRGLGVFALAYAVATGVSIAVVGWPTFVHYLGLVLERAGYIYLYAALQSSLATVYRLMVGTSAEVEQGVYSVKAVVPLAVKIVYWAWCALALGLCAWAIRRVKDAFYRANLLVLLGLVVSPSVLVDYFSLAFIPVFGLVRAKTRPLVCVIAALGFILLDLPLAYYAHGVALRFLCLNLFLGVVVVFAAYLVMAVKPQGSGPVHKGIRKWLVLRWLGLGR